MPRYAYAPFPYRPPPERETGAPIVIVGAGPIGLAAAIDCALHGVSCIVLDDNNVVSTGSRAICWSKRSLEIFDRLGVGARMAQKGVTWRVGRLFHGDREVWNFDLLPEPGHRMPAFVNLQQYYVEQYLVERAADFPDLIDLRWKHRAAAVRNSPGGVTVSVETPDGAYDLAADWLVACDGARSTVREQLGLAFQGRVFEERFLIADVEMQADFPSERLFWFEPTFHPGQSALLHKQPDNIYRIDLQLGWDADPEIEKRPENVIPRIERMIGHRDFTLDWVSVYTFQCRRLERFVHERVVFAGDAAHVVSPFGARGGNGGVHDVDNLVWKLAMVVRGAAPESLVAAYDAERLQGADENIENSWRSTAFMSPKSETEKIFRDAILALAGEHAFARPLVNSGRLSLPAIYDASPLNGPDCADLPPATQPGAPAVDAPLGERWLLDRLGGRFQLLAINADAPETIAAHGVAVERLALSSADDATGALGQRYLGAAQSAVYLIRPDQHVAARWSVFDRAAVEAALARAMGF